MTENRRLRLLLLLGTPVLTLLLLLFHPRPDPSTVGTLQPSGGMDVVALLGPVAGRFLVVHVLFAPLLALLGLSVVRLLDGVRSQAATLARISAFVFAVSYIMYETIAGTATSLLARGALALSPEGQAVISAAVNRILGNPILGDPSFLFAIASLSWSLAVIPAAVALRRTGHPRLPCILLGLSFIFFSHASLLGLVGLLLFFFGVVGVERAKTPVAIPRAPAHVSAATPDVLEVIQK